MEPFQLIPMYPSFPLCIVLVAGSGSRLVSSGIYLSGRTIRLKGGKINDLQIELQKKKRNQ